MILLASGKVHQRLLRESDLAEVSADAGSDEIRCRDLLSGALQAPIVRLDPAFILPLGDETESVAGDAIQRRSGRVRSKLGASLSGTARYELRDKIFAHLLGKTVCHVVVLEDPEKAGRGRDIREVTLDEGPTDLQRLGQWYDEFDKEARQRVHIQNKNYTHFLILVLTGEVASPKDAEVLKRLFREGHPDKFHACFLMLRQLNVGEFKGNERRFHSRVVWPAAVSRLLCLLAADEFGNQNAVEKGVYAWRADDATFGAKGEDGFGLAALVESQRKQMTLAVENLEIQSPTDPAPAPLGPGLTEKTDLQKLAEQRDWRTRDWRHWPARVMDDPERWEEELRKNGKLAARALWLDNQWRGDAGSMLSKVWGVVSASPMGADRVLKKLASVPKIDAAARLKDAQSAWTKVVGWAGRWMSRRESLFQGADFMEKARFAYVNGGYRVAIALAVALLMGYFLAALCNVFLDKQVWWMVAGGGTATIALVGLIFAIVTMARENEQGRQDAAVFVAGLRAADEDVIRRDEESRRTLAVAADFRNRMKMRQAYIWMEMLLERVRTMVGMELQVRTTDNRRRQRLGATERDRELLDYADATSLLLAAVRREQGRSAIFEETAAQWKDQMIAEWKAMCKDCRAGHVPAESTIMFLRQSVVDLRNRLAKSRMDALEENDLRHVDDGLRMALSNPDGPFLSLPYDKGVNGDRPSRNIFLVRNKRKIDSSSAHWVEGPVMGDMLGILFRLIPLAGIVFDQQRGYWRLNNGWSLENTEASPPVTEGMT